MLNCVGALGELATAAGGLAEENAALEAELAGTRCAQRHAAANVEHLEVAALLGIGVAWLVRQVAESVGHLQVAASLRDSF